LTSKLSEDSDSDGDPDASDAESIESRDSGLSEPDEFVAQALFDEVSRTFEYMRSGKRFSLLFKRFLR
jgi:hypothetical protein